MLIISAIILLISCSNETVKPVDNKTQHTFLAPEFFPTSVGSWWIVSNYYIDEEGNITETNPDDSIAIVSEKNIYGTTALEIITYSTETKLPSDTVYRLLEGEQIIEFDEIPFFTFKSWYTLADFSSEEPWITLDTNLVNFELATDFKFSGKYVITSQKTDTSTITFKGQEIETVKFKTDYILKGTIMNLIPIEFTIERTSVFARNIGLIGAINDEIKVKFQSFYQNTKVREMKDYMIIK